MPENITNVIVIVIGLAAIFAAWKLDLIRPASFARWSASGKPDATARIGILDQTPAIMWILGSFGLLAAQVIGGTIGAAVLATRHSSKSIPTMTDLSLPELALMTCWTYAVGLLGVMVAANFYIRTLKNLPAESSGLSPSQLVGVGWPQRYRKLTADLSEQTPQQSDSHTSWRQTLIRSIVNAAIGLGLTLPICLMVATLSAVITLLLTGMMPEQIAHDTLRVIRENWDIPQQRLSVVLITLGSVVAAPIVEEFFFRASLQSLFVKVTKSRWRGILITSVLFTLMHVDWSSTTTQPDSSAVSVAWHALPIIFALSIGLGIAYERCASVRRGGLLTPILMHMGFNLFNLVLMLLETSASKA